MFSAIFCRFRQTLLCFSKDTKAAVIPILAVALIPLIVMAGVGIDYARAINERAILSQALDSAALNIASQLSTSIMTNDEIQTALQAYVDANVSSLVHRDAAIENLTFNVDSDAGTVEVSSQIAVPTYFIKLGGIGPDNITMTVNSEVNYSKFDVELALILDVTGSMGQDPNDIAGLREAAEDLVDTLIPDGTAADDSKIRISIIPYSQGVNLGADASLVSNGTAQGSCVTEREADAQFTDAAYNWGSDIEGDDPSVTTYFGGGLGGCPSTELLPLTADRDALIDEIQALTASGATAGQTGIAWGWYTLSPNWASFWPSDSEPAEYENEDVLKFAIIMTDGDFNLHYDYVQSGQECVSSHTETETYRDRWGRWRTRTVTVCDEYENTYAWDWDQISGYNGPSAERGRELCDGMKDAGIDLYSIYFDTGGSGEEEMEYCASDSNQFYSADDPSDLIEAFGNIAKRIQAIYLAK